MWCCSCDPLFSRFSRTPTCDTQTDRHRHRHRPMASTADGSAENARQKMTDKENYGMSFSSPAFSGRAFSVTPRGCIASRGKN